ncbi:MAG: hypothetical protein ACLR70_02765 [Streptococcus thermophilus]
MSSGFYKNTVDSFALGISHDNSGKTADYKARASSTIRTLTLKG